MSLRNWLALTALALSACGSEDAQNPWFAGHDAAAGGDSEPWGDATAEGKPESGSGGQAGDGAAPADAGNPWVTIVSPKQGEKVANPVSFAFEAGGGVKTVWFEADGYPLQATAIPVAQGSHTYKFTGVNTQRHVVLQGRDQADQTVATDEVDFTPVSCILADQPGFNHYTIAAINNTSEYPKDGSSPYCWESQGGTCGAHWGMVHDGLYTAEKLFPGGGDCFCSGHTLEIFLRAYRLWQKDKAVAEDVPFTVGANQLLIGDVDPYGSNGGHFYQYWQGFGITNEASAAEGFAQFGIGKSFAQSEWDQVLPGDYVNLSRTTGSGHAVIFVDWIVENGAKVGLRYYGCNSHGDSCPDETDPLNTTNNSGPSFNTELFDGMGGTVIPKYLFIGRAFEPG
ncbi:MAG: hypothetical protein HY898_26800 [Deltaproteobacteria bacterium]|nr:hypothetical protein [Deltaproteobacteria bacterium]